LVRAVRKSIPALRPAQTHGPTNARILLHQFAVCAFLPARRRWRRFPVPCPIKLYPELYPDDCWNFCRLRKWLFLLVGAPRFELGTPCTPCKCATRLRHAPTRLFFLMRTRHAWRGEGAAQKPNDTAILGEGCGFSAAGSSSDPRAQRAPASRSADSARRRCAPLHPSASGARRRS
jgi:hypothetical protein